jgi:hypothetical protein
MAISDWGHPSGFMPRNVAAGDSPGQIRLISYVNSSGVETGEACRIVRLFNDRGAACVLGGVYMVDFDATVAQNLKVATCVAETSVQRQVVVAMAATADQAWGWFAYAGYVDALVDGDTTDVAAGDYLKITAGTNADAFLGNTTSRTVDSFAIAMAANTSTEALTKVFLLGDPADVD